MNEQQAREILGDSIRADGALDSVRKFLMWPTQAGDRPPPNIAVLDGDFSADELEAIAWWMRNSPSPATDPKLPEYFEPLGKLRRQMSEAKSVAMCKGCERPLTEDKQAKGAEFCNSACEMAYVAQVVVIR